MEIPWWFGFVSSAALALLRYRVPAIPPRLASAGIGAFIVVSALGFFTVTPLLAASLVINGALFAAGLDIWLSTRRRQAPLGSAKSAALTLNFTPTNPPAEVTHQNVFTWYTTSLLLTAHDEQGQKHRHVFNQWVVAVWFDEPVFDYTAKVESLSGEHLVTSVQWQTARGVFVMVEAPSAPAVIRISVQSRA